MGKLMFIPVSVAAGILAGLAGRKAFDLTWSLIDGEEPPEAEHRDVSWARLATALALEGAIFAAVRGIADHAARRAFARSTGAWPGEEEPDRL